MSRDISLTVLDGVVTAHYGSRVTLPRSTFDLDVAYCIHWYGPLLFSIYTSSIAVVAQSHGVQQQQYADDTQLYIALTLSDPSSELAALQSCLTSLQVWFYTNGMALNPDKSHAILLGTTQRAQSFRDLQSIDVAGSATSLVSHIKLLGVTLDSHLTMSEHTKLVSQSSFYHIHALRHIRGVLDQSTAAAIASALISSRLDYANSCLLYTSPSPRD